MNLLLATRSAGKQREMRRVLDAAGHTVKFPDEAGVPESVEESALELTDSLETNARQKAEYFARKTGLPTIADDSGLEVLALGGAPGVRSKRWAGATGSPAEVDTENNAELLRRLLGAQPERRRARYRCVIVLLRRKGAIPEVFFGTSEGSILESPRGDQGFGYDPLFLSDDLGKTFGEATAEEKDGVSHRGRALTKLIEALKSGEQGTGNRERG